MSKYRKKPVVIEAFQLGVDAIPDWFMDQVSANEITLKNDKMPFGCHIDQIGDYANSMYCLIKTLEGEMRGDYGDYIIKGVKGEIYPCKPDIFEMTYDLITEPKNDWIMSIKRKILQSIQLTEEEVRSIYYDEVVGIVVVDEEKVWKRNGYNIIKIILEVFLEADTLDSDSKYFSIWIHKGAYQDEYPMQVAQEVEPKEVIKIEWVRKQQGKDND